MYKHVFEIIIKTVCLNEKNKNKQTKKKKTKKKKTKKQTNKKKKILNEKKSFWSFAFWAQFFNRVSYRDIKISILKYGNDIDIFC